MSFLIDALRIPDSCRLDRRVFKRLFLESDKLTPQDRRTFAKDVEEVVWRHTLKPSTTAIMPFSDDEREYEEIAVLEASVKSQSRALRISEVIHRVIPYPLVLAVGDGQAEFMSVAPKRLSRSDRGAVVVEEILATEWLSSDSTSEAQREFVNSLAFDTLPQSNYLVLYAALSDRLLALRTSARTGEFFLFGAAERQLERKALLEEAESLEAQIASRRAALRRETQFSRRVELNTEIKQLQSEMDHAVTRLKSTRNGA